MKNWSFLKMVQLVFWTLALVGVMAALGFAAKEERSIPCREVDIHIYPEVEQAFTDEQDIAKMVTGSGTIASFIGQPMGSFPVNDLEKTIETSPYVENAEVYRELDGTLKLDVQQRTPVVRIFRNLSGGYYIDHNGKKMPLSDKYSARVLVATGNIYERYEGNDSLYSKVGQELFILADFISKHPLWSKQIDEVYVNQNSEFVLIPKVGNQKILVGDASELEDKFKRLWLFYRKAVNRVGWETYKVINLKYTGQIVCEK